MGVKCNAILAGGGASRPAWLVCFSAVTRSVGTFHWATPMVALVLLVAAVLKAHQLATEPIFGAGLLESRWLLVAVVQYELFLAFWLFSGLFPRTAWWFAIGTFGLFAVVSGAKALAGEPTCGCFGRVPTSPWLSLSINLAAIVALTQSRLTTGRPSAGAVDACPTRASSQEVGPSREPAPAGNQASRWLCGTWILAATGLATVAFSKSATNELPGIGRRVGDSVIIEPEKMVGQPFTLAHYIDIGEQLNRGRWLVVLYRTDCPRCRKLQDDLAKITIPPGRRIQIACLSVGNRPQQTDYVEGAARDLGFITGTLSGPFDWLVNVPLYISIDENAVVAVATSIETTSPTFTARQRPIRFNSSRNSALFLDWSSTEFYGGRS